MSNKQTRKLIEYIEKKQEEHKNLCELCQEKSWTYRTASEMNLCDECEDEYCCSNCWNFIWDSHNEHWYYCSACF